MAVANEDEFLDDLALLGLASYLGWTQAGMVQSGQAALNRFKRFFWHLLDGQIGAQVRAAFGGRLRVAVSGGAPMPTDVAMAAALKKGMKIEKFLIK